MRIWFGKVILVKKNTHDESEYNASMEIILDSTGLKYSTRISSAQPFMLSIMLLGIVKARKH